MPNFSVQVEIAAGATNANIFAGSAFEFIGRPSRVAVAMIAGREAGLVVDAYLTATVQFGPEVQLEEGQLPVETILGDGCKMPDDIVVDDVAAAGDRLVGRVTNADAIARTVKCKVRILPIQ